MNPWDILGWILVVWIGLMVGLKLLIIGLDLYEKAHSFMRRYILHLRTRNTPLAEGQRWYGAGLDTYEIRGVSDTHVALRSGNVSWGDKHDAWKRRLRRQHLYLGSTR